VVALATEAGLVFRVGGGLAAEHGIAGALGAARALRVDPHGEDQRPLCERGGGQAGELVDVRRLEAVVLARRPRQDRDDTAGILRVGMIHDEDAGAAPHRAEAGIGDERRAAVVESQPAEDPRRAARGEPLLHGGTLEVAAGRVVGSGRLRLDGDQQHRPRLAGGVARGGVVVDPLHGSGAGWGERHGRCGLDADGGTHGQQGSGEEKGVAGRDHACLSSV